MIVYIEYSILVLIEMRIVYDIIKVKLCANRYAPPARELLGIEIEI
jgi:hypothetical protein